MKIKRRSRSVLILVILSFVYNVANGRDDMMAIGSEEDLLFQDIPSVYSASKYEQKITEAPSSVSIITKDEIKKYGYRTIGAVLASLRGFYSTNDRNYGYLGLRGFGLPSDYNTRILLLIDGHRYNEVIYDSFDSSTLFPVDIDLIERVEVVRGPSSSLYGSSAFFGVVNIITTRGRDLKGVGVSAEYGSHDAYKGRLSYGNRFQNGLELFLSGTFFDSQGDDYLYYKEFDDPVTNNGVYEKNDEDQFHNVLANLSYGDFTLQGAFAHREKDIPTGSYGTIFNDPRTKVMDEQGYLDLAFEHDFDHQLNVLARLSYNYYRYSGDFAYDYADDNEPLFRVINKDKARAQWWRGELQGTKVLWDQHRVTLGTEYQNNFEETQNNHDLEVYFDDDRDSSEWAIFIQDEYSITDNLILNAGVRYDYFSQFGDTINPRAALIYNPFERTTIKLLYGKAFRAPNNYEAFYHDSEAQVQSVNLTPETIETLELVLEHYIDRHLRGVLAVFYNKIDDVITLTTRPDDFLIFENGGEIETFGAEAEIEGKWDNGATGRLSYSYQNTKNEETGERLTNSPEHMVKLNLIAPLLSDHLFAGLESQYMSERRSPRGHVGDHFITNLTLISQNWIEGLRLSASIYNLFDKEYFDPGSEEHEQNGIEQEGRNFRVKVNFEF